MDRFDLSYVFSNMFSLFWLRCGVTMFQSKKFLVFIFFISFARIKQKLKIELKIIQNLYRYKLRPLIRCFINVSDLHPLHVAIIYMRLHSDLVWPYLPEHCSAR